MFTSPGLGGRRLGHGVVSPSRGGPDSERWLVRLQSLITYVPEPNTHTHLNLLVKSHESREHSSSSRLSQYRGRPHKRGCRLVLTPLGLNGGRREGSPCPRVAGSTPRPSAGGVSASLLNMTSQHMMPQQLSSLEDVRFFPTSLNKFDRFVYTNVTKPNAHQFLLNFSRPPLFC